MISFSAKQQDIISRPFDYTLEVNEGTPRSSKTTAGVFRYANYLIRTRDENHLVTAYNQEQAFRLVMESDGLGLINIFGANAKVKHDDKGDHLEVNTPNGVRRVYYKGGGKVVSKKAITGMSLGSVFFCEIDLLHIGMIHECFRRTFAAKDRYHLADLNPPAPQHPVIKEVFELQHTRWEHWTIDDNPIITEKRKKEIYDVLIKNPYLYKRDWLGLRVMPSGVIYSMFDPEAQTKKKIDKDDIVEMFFSGDGGQSDATSVACNVVTFNNKTSKFELNRVAHYYHSGADTGQVKAMSVYAREIKAFIAWCEKKYQHHRTDVYIDPSCKSLREELKMIGIATRGANNNSKDVTNKAKGMEVGIERAQNLMDGLCFFIVEQLEEYDHYNFLKEVGMYVRDDKGKPIDKYNHSLDEMRYAVNYFYSRYVR